ncbi:MAG: exodeoxyribonuclease VII large subunit [Ruminococcaceae bacterium]|nr:exodeoxyribonuclease VII large subunit [Oscillospiraceae bacterium]
MKRERGVLSITQLNDYIKMILDGDRVLSDVWVRGEISNFTAPRSGHFYLTLKDVDGQVRSVMFRTHAARLPFRPEDGMKVLAHGRVSVYGPTGQYQLYLDELQPDGAGALAMQYEQLRRKLEGEGLFEASRKRKIPEMPMRIGVITSPVGAAVQDIRNILRRRFPCAEMILFPSAVQGVEAVPQLCLGIEFFGMTEMCDVIIIGRGGGSAEDLWAFNDETLARTIAACPIPVISAVGHESDFTICDFVADLRAPTPSAAAELAVPDRGEILMQLRSMQARMQRAAMTRLERERLLLRRLERSRIFEKPEAMLDRHRMRVSEMETRLDRLVDTKLERARHALRASAAKLEALSPLSVLTRGYAAVSRDGVALTSAGSVRVGDRIDIRFSDGCVSARAENVKGIEKNGKKRTEI